VPSADRPLLRLTDVSITHPDAVRPTPRDVTLEVRRGEVVHHINQIKDDDRPENLQKLASRVEHTRLHKTGLAQSATHRANLSRSNRQAVHVYSVKSCGKAHSSCRICRPDLYPVPDPATQRARVVENLKALGPIAAREGITILLEALNSLVDHKGYFLDSAKAGFDIIREVDHPNVRLLYDVYHMQIMEGNIIDSVTRNMDLIGHFHAAGVPGRHELFTGELDYRHILDAIGKTGYRGAFGLEYWPTMDHAESLRKTAEYLGSSGRS